MAQPSYPMAGVPSLAAAGAGLPNVLAGGQRMLGTPLDPGPDGRTRVFAAGSTLAGAVSGFGGGAPFAGMTSSVSGTTMGFETNETINKAWPARPFKNGWEKTIAQGDLLFRRLKMHPDSDLLTLVNVQHLNYFLELDDMYEGEGGGARRPRAAQDFADDWAFLGIVQANLAKRRGMRAASDTFVQATVGGMQHMTNVFGNHVLKGTRLWGVVRECTFGSAEMVGPTGTSVGAVRTRNARALQVDFFGDYRFDTVPSNLLTYYDAEGRLQRSHVFFIGTAMENAHTVGAADRLAALRDQAKYATLSPPFQVCVAH